MKKRALTESEKRKIERMAMEGKDIAKITTILCRSGDDYFDLYYKVLAYTWESEYYGWRSSKVMITNNLNRLEKVKNKDIRLRLIREIREFVNYLYYSGRALQQKVDNARKALK